MKKGKKVLNAKENFKKKMPSKSLRWKFPSAHLLLIFPNRKRNLLERKHKAFFKDCTITQNKQKLRTSSRENRWKIKSKKSILPLSLLPKSINAANLS